MKVILMMVTTADGKIAKTAAHLPDWGSPEDKKLFAKITKEIGVVIMGSNTFKTFSAPLPGRLNVVFSKNAGKETVPGVKFVSGEPDAVLHELEAMGYKSAVLAGGTAVNSLFLKKNLIDEIYLTIEPKIFGTGFNIFEADYNLNLELISMEKLNENSIFLKYGVLK